MSKIVKIEFNGTAQDFEIAGYTGVIDNVKLPKGFDKLYPWIVRGEVKGLYEKANYLFGDLQVPYYMVESLLAPKAAHTPINMKEKRVSARAQWFLVSKQERRNRIKMFLKHSGKEANLITTDKAALDSQSITKAPKLPKLDEVEVIEMFDLITKQRNEHKYDTYPSYLKSEMLMLTMDGHSNNSLVEVAAKAITSYFGIKLEDFDKVVQYVEKASAEDINSPKLGNAILKYLSGAVSLPEPNSEELEALGLSVSTEDSVRKESVADCFYRFAQVNNLMVYKEAELIKELSLKDGNMLDPVDTLILIHRDYVLDNTDNDLVRQMLNSGITPTNTYPETEDEEYAVYELTMLIESKLDIVHNGTNRKYFIHSGVVYRNNSTIEEIVRLTMSRYKEYLSLEDRSDENFRKVGLLALSHQQFDLKLDTQLLNYVWMSQSSRVERQDMARVVESVHLLLRYIEECVIGDVVSVEVRNDVIGVISAGASACALFLAGFESNNEPIFLSGLELINKHEELVLFETLDDMAKLMHIDVEREAPLFHEALSNTEIRKEVATTEQKDEFEKLVQYMSNISIRARTLFIDEGATIQELLNSWAEGVNEFGIVLQVYKDENIVDGIGAIQSLFKYAQTNATVGYAPTPDLIRSIITGAALTQDVTKRDIVDLYGYIEYLVPKLKVSLLDESPVRRIYVDSNTLLAEHKQVLDAPVTQDNSEFAKAEISAGKDGLCASDSTYRISERLDPLAKGDNMYAHIKSILMTFKGRSLFISGPSDAQYVSIRLLLSSYDSVEKFRDVLKNCGESINYNYQEAPDHIREIFTSYDAQYLATHNPTKYEAVQLRDFIEELILISEVAWDSYKNLPTLQAPDVVEVVEETEHATPGIGFTEETVDFLEYFVDNISNYPEIGNYLDSHRAESVPFSDTLFELILKVEDVYRLRDIAEGKTYVFLKELESNIAEELLAVENYLTKPAEVQMDIIDTVINNAGKLPNFTYVLEKNEKSWVDSKEDIIEVLKDVYDGVQGEVGELDILERFLHLGEVISITDEHAEDLPSIYTTIESYSQNKINLLDKPVEDISEVSAEEWVTREVASGLYPGYTDLKSMMKEDLTHAEFLNLFKDCYPGISNDLSQESIEYIEGQRTIFMTVDQRDDVIEYIRDVVNPQCVNDFNGTLDTLSLSISYKGHLAEQEEVKVIEPMFDIPLYKLRKSEIPHAKFSPVKIEYMRGVYKRVAETLQTLTGYEEMPAHIVKQWSPYSESLNVDSLSSGQAYQAIQAYAYNLNPLATYEGALNGTYTLQMETLFNTMKAEDKGSVPEFVIGAFKVFGDTARMLELSDKDTVTVAEDLGPLYLGEAVAYLFTRAYGSDYLYDYYKSDFREVVQVLSNHLDYLKGIDMNLNDIYQIIAKELPSIATKLTTTNNKEN